jgi:Ca2+-binding EF-hand superfamily protein
LDENAVKLLPEMYKDPEFMDFMANSLFSSMDTDHNGVIDWPELIIGLSVLAHGNREEEAKCCLKCIVFNKNQCGFVSSILT